MVEVMKNHKSFLERMWTMTFCWWIIRQNIHQSAHHRPFAANEYIYFISNPEALCLRFLLFKIYSKPATCNTHADTLKHFSLCVTHRVKWKEQTVSFTPVVPELLSDVRGGSPFILSPLNPTSRGPFPILVKEYVSECLLCKVYSVPFELWERLESFQGASDLPAFLRRSERALQPNTWAFHMSSAITRTLQLPFILPFACLIRLSISFYLFLSVFLSFLLPVASLPFKAHTFSLNLMVSLSAVKISSGVITGASLPARCSGYPCRHGWIWCRGDWAFLRFLSRMIGYETAPTAIRDILEQWDSQNAQIKTGSGFQKARRIGLESQPLNFWMFNKLCSFWARARAQLQNSVGFGPWRWWE